MTRISNHKTSIIKSKNLSYPKVPPFNPSSKFPEYRLGGKHVADDENTVYAEIRNLFRNHELDIDNYGSSDWNPLGEFVEPGESVVIKPNWVLSYHLDNEDVFSIITHPSVLRTIIDYVYIALAGKGQIIVADSPQWDCDWNTLMSLMELDAIKKIYKDELQFDIEIRDLRVIALSALPYYGFAEEGSRKSLKGDPLGYSEVDLGARSMFAEIAGKDNLCGIDLKDRQETIDKHQTNRNCYDVARTFQKADVVINVPKLKTHKKVGVTLNLKAIVGTIGNKNTLPHFRKGKPSENGDAYPEDKEPRSHFLLKVESKLKDLLLKKGNRFGEVIFKSLFQFGRYVIKPLMRPNLNRSQTLGNWYGNDTCWRMVGDINKIFYGYRGNECEYMFDKKTEKRFLSIIDGITAGEANGPLTPTPIQVGALLFGTNPLSVDLTAIKLMGFDYNKIRLYRNIIADSEFRALLDFDPESGIPINVNGNECNEIPQDIVHQMTPHDGWLGHIEAELDR